MMNEHNYLKMKYTFHTLWPLVKVKAALQAVVSFIRILSFWNYFSSRNNSDPEARIHYTTQPFGEILLLRQSILNATILIFMSDNWHFHTIQPRIFSQGSKTKRIQHLF